MTPSIDSHDDLLWYFAYGSNLDPERFRDRVGDFSDHRRAILHDHALRFSGEVTSEGGGGAIIESSPGSRVYGGVYLLERAQLEKMDEIELGSDMDPAQRAARHTVALDCRGEALHAEVYVVPAPEVYRAPSQRYLQHIIKGLRWFGYDDAVVEQVQAVAAREPGRRQPAPGGAKPE